VRDGALETILATRVASNKPLTRRRRFEPTYRQHSTPRKSHSPYDTNHVEVSAKETRGLWVGERA